MVTPSEAVEAMEAMIRNMPEKHEGFGFLVSKQIAQGLYDFNFNVLSGSRKMIAESGQEFEYRGIKCKVA